MLPRFSLRRLDAVALAALVMALAVLAIVRPESRTITPGFAFQALVSAGWLLRRAAGNRRLGQRLNP